MLSPAQHNAAVPHAARHRGGARRRRRVRAADRSGKPAGAQSSPHRLQGDDAERFKTLLAACGLYRRLHASPPICCRCSTATASRSTIPGEPDFLFDTPQDALKSHGRRARPRQSPARRTRRRMTARAQAFARVAIDGLLGRRGALHGARQLREQPYPHRRGRFHARRFRRRARPAAQAAGHELQEAERDHRQPYRQIPGDAAGQDARWPTTSTASSIRSSNSAASCSPSSATACRAPARPS